MGLKNFGLGLCLGFLISCGSLGFTYKFYGLSAKYYDGTLLGPTTKDDIPFSRCDNRNCIVFLKSDFFRLKEDFLKMKSDLKDCQRGR